MVIRKSDVEKSKGKNSRVYDGIDANMLATIKEAMYGLGGNTSVLLHEALVVAIAERRVKYEALEEFYNSGCYPVLHYDIKTIKKELGI